MKTKNYAAGYAHYCRRAPAVNQDAHRKPGERHERERHHIDAHHAAVIGLVGLQHHQRVVDRHVRIGRKPHDAHEHKAQGQPRRVGKEQERDAKQGAEDDLHELRVPARREIGYDQRAQQTPRAGGGVQKAEPARVDGEHVRLKDRQEHLVGPPKQQRHEGQELKRSSSVRSVKT